MPQETRLRKGIRLRSDLALCLGFFILALSIRLLYLDQIKRLPLFYILVSDSLTYDEWAQQIAAGDWWGQAVFFQAPLYPYFLGLLEAIFGHDLFLIRIVQGILGALSCSLIFWAGKGFFSRSAGVWAGIIAAFLLLIGLPAALWEAQSGVWQAWLFAFSCLYAGVGLAVGARTGRWIVFWKSHDKRTHHDM